MVNHIVKDELRSGAVVEMRSIAVQQKELKIVRRVKTGVSLEVLYRVRGEFISKYGGRRKRCIVKFHFVHNVRFGGCNRTI